MSYLDRLFRIPGRTPLRRGSVSLVEIVHDDTCSHWRGGECDCPADLRLVDEDGNVLDVLPDGGVARGEDPGRGDNPGRRAFLDGIQQAKRERQR